MNTTRNKVLPSGGRVLIIKLSSLGDLFHALPVVHILKTELDATIDWVTQPEYIELVRCFPQVTRVIGFPRHRFAAGFFSFRRELREERYDSVIDLQGLFKSGFVSRLARSGRRIGPSYHREGSGMFYTDVVGKNESNRHAVTKALDISTWLGLKDAAPVFDTSFPDVSLEKSGLRIALVPCSRWKTKNWAPQNFGYVGMALQNQLGAAIYVVGSPDDQNVCAGVAEMIPHSVDLSGRCTLPKTGGILKQMDLVISVDSGPMHMAAAVDTPVIAVFGSTNPLLTGPFGSGHHVIQTEGLSCCPCLSRTCARGDLACLSRVGVDDVVEKAMSILTS